MHLYLIRHGQSYVNLPNWQKGNRDESLTEVGHEQAEALAAYLPKRLQQIDWLYASTMRRAQETAAYLADAYDMPVISDTRLREVGNNRLDHLPWPDDDLPDYGEFWGTERPFSSITPDRDGGESWMHFRLRVGAIVEELVKKHRDETVVIVCHGGVIEAVISNIFNVGPWSHCEVWSRNTAVTRIQFVNHPTRERWRLHYHNNIEHLLQGKTVT